MSQRRSRVRTRARYDPATVGTATTRLGFVLVVATVPIVAGTLGSVLIQTETVGGALAAVLAVMGGPLLAQHGIEWLFHVTTIGLLCGCWLVGLGLLLDGLFAYSSD